VSAATISDQGALQPRRSALYAGNTGAVIHRGLLATRSTNYLVVLSGFFEPVFYLLSLGIGFGALVGSVQTSTGQEVSYAAFIAPALLAVSAMNWGGLRLDLERLLQTQLFEALVRACSRHRSARST